MNLKVKTNKKTSVLSFEIFLVFQMVWFGSNDLVQLLMVRFIVNKLSIINGSVIFGLVRFDSSVQFMVFNEQP
jgi:hypothetical protein